MRLTDAQRQFRALRDLPRQAAVTLPPGKGSMKGDCWGIFQMPALPLLLRLWSVWASLLGDRAWGRTSPWVSLFLPWLQGDGSTAQRLGPLIVRSPRSLWFCISPHPGHIQSSQSLFFCNIPPHQSRGPTVEALGIPNEDRAWVCLCRKAWLRNPD